MQPYTQYPLPQGAYHVQPGQQPQHPSSYLAHTGNQNGSVHDGHTRRTRRRYRAPTVEEALTFTPLTSIVPFSQNILPYPSPSSSTIPNLFANDEARRRAWTQLQLLDREASNGQAPPPSLQRLKHLLNGTKLTTYEFSPLSNLGDPTSHTRQSSGAHAAKHNLSPFAQLALRSSTVAHHLPTLGASPSSITVKHIPAIPTLSLKRIGTQHNEARSPSQSPRYNGQARQASAMLPKEENQEWIDVRARSESEQISHLGGQASSRTEKSQSRVPDGAHQRDPFLNGFGNPADQQRAPAPQTTNPAQLQRTQLRQNHGQNPRSFSQNQNVAVVIPSNPTTPSHRSLGPVVVVQQASSFQPKASPTQSGHNCGAAVVIHQTTSSQIRMSSSQNTRQLGPAVVIEKSFTSPHKPSSSQKVQHSGPQVVVAIPPSSQLSDYQDFTAPEQSRTIGQKRKRDTHDIGDAGDIRIDQRAKSEEALRTLQNTIREISLIEEHMKSRSVQVDTSFYFAQTAYNEDDALILTHQVQERLETSIHRAIDASCFNKVPVERLVKVQKLCESTLSLIEVLTLTVDESATSDDIDEWLQRVRLTENSLHAARILLRILTAGREDKELYSENSLQTISECLELVMNRCIIPVVEIRNSGREEALFKIYSMHKKALGSLFNMYGQTLRLLSDLILKVDVERVVDKVQDLATKLIFVENSYSEKDSALGTTRFEKLRTRAMQVVATIFHRYLSQRPSIFNDIVTSLEKLPVTRQSARQFKAHEGKSIQLVSALLMRLVQTSGTHPTSTRVPFAGTKKVDMDTSEDDASSAGPASPAKVALPGEMDIQDEMDPEDADFDLRKLTDPLYTSAVSDASHVIQYLVGRAQNTTKSGDSPYRKLLEIFVEDFISVLGLPMWPGAELLLRVLLSKIFHLLSDEKTPIPAKNMALDIMGVLGTGIIDLQLFVKRACRNSESADSPLTTRLARIANDYMENGDEQQVNKFRGPYRVLMEYLHAQAFNDVQAPSARGLHLTQWAKTTLVHLSKDDEPSVAPELSLQLRNMMIDPKWLENEYDSIEAMGITPQQGRLAASIITVASPFAKSLPKVMDNLVHYMTSTQSTLKSRSLKSVTELINKDPSILERNRSVIYSIMKGMQDSSPQVRDSALMLLDKCIVLRPTLADVHVHSRIIMLAADESKSVRKHAMKVLKEIYLRTNDQNLQAHISAALMARVNDIEANVAEMAQQTFEELWMIPFHKSAHKDSVQCEIELKFQVVLIVKTVQRGEEAVDVLDTLLHNVLSPDSKSRKINLDVCKDMVRLMFDEIIDNEERTDRPSQQHLAQALTVFAKAEPLLFTSEQLRLLLPYLQNLTTSAQLVLYRFVAIIMRHVIPTLNLADRELLAEIQSNLMQPIAKLGKEELAEAAACLWTIHGILKTERLVVLMKSALVNVNARKSLDFKDPANEKALNHVKKYMEIASFFGRECDFDEYAEVIRKQLPFWKGTSVSSLIIDLFCPFTRQNYPQVLREAALDSIATICQSWPQHYQRPDVSTAFDLVFRNDDRRFMQVVLSGFLLFFKQEERRSETGAEIKVGDGAMNGNERLQKSFIAGDADAGATTIAQKFLPHVLRVARSSIDDLAVTATQVIASINRQGLVHPKECGPILVVLETSTNKTISDIAFAEHKIQHLKHETVFDKHYMTAVQETFEYQRGIIQDPRGVRLQPTTPKMHMLFEVLRVGSGKVRKRFLGNIVSRMDFDLGKLSARDAMPMPLLFARFVVENLGFFDYVRVDEIVHLVSCLEKLVVHGVGTTVAHAIETEILKVQLPQTIQPTIELVADEPSVQLAQESLAQPINQDRLRQLTVSSMILSMVWETRTHIRQQWGLAKQNKSVGKPAAKDLNKPATKVPFFRSDLLDKLEAIMSSLVDPLAQMAQCKAFVELVAVDHEHKIASDDDEEAELARQAAGYETPDEGAVETASNPSSTGRGRKRKASAGAIGTPSAKRGRPRKTEGTPKRPRGGGAGRGGRSKTASTDGDDGAWD